MITPNDRSAVVTGCGAGIGEAVIQALASAGYWVVGIERDRLLRDRAEANLAGRGNLLLGDVRDRSVLDEAAASARRAAPLRGWVNNAGIESRGALHEVDSSKLEELLAVDLMAFVWGCQVAVRSFMEQRSPGSIVNISSLHGRRGYSGWAAYDVAKGGVDALTRYVAVEYGPVGIRANAVAPGSVRTEMHKRYVESTPHPAETEREMAAVVPLRRIAEPDEIASVVVFLLSDTSSYLTGQSLPVDGGLSVAGGVFAPHPDLVARYRVGDEKEEPAT